MQLLKRALHLNYSLHARCWLFLFEAIPFTLNAAPVPGCSSTNDSRSLVGLVALNQTGEFMEINAELFASLTKGKYFADDCAYL
jgi:hypothetical protein